MNLGPQSGHQFHNMSKLKNVFRSLHIIWAIIGVCATIVLAMAKGHPPGILRQAWSRILASGMFITGALILLYQMIESIMLDRQHSSFDWITSVIITICCISNGHF